MRPSVTVVHIRSLSYSGTSWLNLVLGCHEDSIAFCSLDRLWEIAQGEISIPWQVVHTKLADPCLVHGEQCDFWPAFLNSYKVDQNLFVALANYSGKKFIITNNLIPTLAGSQLDDPAVTVKEIQFVRDGRALVASYLRKNPDKAFIEGITGFLQTSFSSFEYDNDALRLCLRFEDMTAEPKLHLQQISRFLGLDYSENSLHYWKWKHHLTGGNPGTIALLRLAEGLDIMPFEGEDFYRAQFSRTTENGPQTFKDERDKNAISRANLFLFDCLAGADNARFGYQRDQFSPQEKQEFGALAKTLVKSGNVPDYFSAQLVPYFSE